MADRRVRIVMPLPDRDFDTTESAVVWAAFVDSGFDVVFATENGAVAECDRFLLGPGLRNTFPSSPETIATYRRMQVDPNFLRPIRYRDIQVNDFDAIHLSGGHSPGMRQYLESKELQQAVVGFCSTGRTIGAICHGVLVPARSIDPATGCSVLHGHDVTTLTKPIERWALRKTWYRVGRRYRTYRMYTEDEVAQAVGTAGKVLRGESMQIPFVVTDGQFVTGRFPLDVPTYAHTLIDQIVKRSNSSTSS